MSDQAQNIDLSNLFLSILGLKKKEPDLSYLTELLLAHYARIPFENISKLFFIKINNHKHLPDLRQYLFGISNYNFGGTCYSNNYYFYQLLKYLGFKVKLCAAEIAQPNSHMAIIANINDSDFLIDVGYGVPLLYPISLDLDEDFTLRFGHDKYVIKPRNENLYTKLELIRDGKLIHGYLLNPEKRQIKDFDNVINSSFCEDSIFLNSLIVSKYISGKFIMINNFELIESDPRAS
ncbi:MAG: arylamine N-acetyltransferase, partial [Saprospiraceae bacterium]|nr:arylamine N-acetyltransferase [Saprospiraceae bacterium]